MNQQLMKVESIINTLKLKSEQHERSIEGMHEQSREIDVKLQAVAVTFQKVTELEKDRQ